MQSSYTLSKSEDTTQASTFFSDATNGTTSALPEFVPDYNKGPVRLRRRAQLGAERRLGSAVRQRHDRRRRRRCSTAGSCRASATMRSGQPLTVFVQTNRSRSQWAPSLGPGIGQDRPSYAAGLRTATTRCSGDPDQWFDPAAFVLQPAGTFGNTGRGDFTGPEPAHGGSRVDEERPLGAAGQRRPRRAADRGVQPLQSREFRRPELRAFAGQADGEAPLATFGRITTTVTSSRQIQLGIRALF